MTAPRGFIPLPLHAAVELLAGLAVMAAPFALGLSAAATVVALVVGALAVGLALHSVDTGDGALPVHAHHAFDLSLIAGLTGAAILVGTAGDDPRAATFFGLVAAAYLALNLSTRYSARS
jgi:hypothetical protein